MDPEPSSPTIEFPQTIAPSLPQLPEPRQVEVDFASFSHQGRVRKNNEDHFLIARPGRTLEVIASNLPEGTAPGLFEQSGYVYMVADGLGGMAAGEYASMLALRACLASILKSDRWCFRPDRQTGPELIRRIRGYYHQIDEVLQQHARSRPELAGMATTLTAVFTTGADAVVAHVGDSRAYLLRGDRLQKMTNDHTIAQYLANTGMITHEEVATHARRHVLMNFAGGPAGGINPDVDPFQIADGDVLLLCTDGLTEMVDEPTIAQVLRGSTTAESATRELVDMALEQGGTDNVTVIVARYRVPFEPGPAWHLGWDHDVNVEL